MASAPEPFAPGRLPGDTRPEPEEGVLRIRVKDEWYRLDVEALTLDEQQMVRNQVGSSIVKLFDDIDSVTVAVCVWLAGWQSKRKRINWQQFKRWWESLHLAAGELELVDPNAEDAPADVPEEDPDEVPSPEG